MRQTIGNRRWTVTVTDEMLIEAFNKVRKDIGSPDSPSEIDADLIRNHLPIADRYVLSLWWIRNAIVQLRKKNMLESDKKLRQS